MNILIITAHPNSKSLSHSIGRRYAKLAIKKGHEIMEIDLYDQNWQQPFYRLEPEENYSPTEYKQLIYTRQNAQQAIRWAKKIVFIHPLWWGGQPAVLKNFLDCNFTSKFAYKNRKPQSFLGKYWPLPKPLLVGKKAKIYITGDGRNWVYSLLLYPFINIWFFFICIYTGLFPTSIRYIGGVKFRDKENLKTVLEKIRI